MASAAPGTTRGGSRSSIRRSQRPPPWRARRKLTAAVVRDPRCRGPVGEGAKRPTEAMRGSAVAVVPIAILAFTALTALLCLETEGRHGPCFRALDADFFPGFEAVSIAAVFDPLQRVVDLADQLAFPIARAQLEAEFLFLSGAVIGVGKVGGFILHMSDSAIDFHHQVALQAQQDLLEMTQLLLAHVLLAALGDVRLDVAWAGQQAPRVRRIVLIDLHRPPRQLAHDRRQGCGRQGDAPRRDRRARRCGARGGSLRGYRRGARGGGARPPGPGAAAP